MIFQIRIQYSIKGASTPSVIMKVWLVSNRWTLLIILRFPYETYPRVLISHSYERRRDSLISAMVIGWSVQVIWLSPGHHRSSFLNRSDHRFPVGWSRPPLQLGVILFRSIGQSSSTTPIKRITDLLMEHRSHISFFLSPSVFPSLAYFIRCFHRR